MNESLIISVTSAIEVGAMHITFTIASILLCYKLICGEWKAIKRDKGEK